jgi:cell division protein FtsB
MARINDKVAMILRRKDADIAEAQRKHDQLTAEVAELSAELERLRDSALN